MYFRGIGSREELRGQFFFTEYAHWVLFSYMAALGRRLDEMYAIFKLDDHLSSNEEAPKHWHSTSWLWRLQTWQRARRTRRYQRWISKSSETSRTKKKKAARRSSWNEEDKECFHEPRVRAVFHTCSNHVNRGEADDWSIGKDFLGK